MSFYRSWVSSFCEPFRTGGLKLTDGDVVPVYPGQQWAPTMAWDNYGGKITLAGDAAHSMVPRKSNHWSNSTSSGQRVHELYSRLINYPLNRAWPGPQQRNQRRFRHRRRDQGSRIRREDSKRIHNSLRGGDEASRRERGRAVLGAGSQGPRQEHDKGQPAFQAWVAARQG